MKIARIQTFKFWADWKNWLFVRVETDDGLHGWGEASTELWESTVEAAVRELGARLLGSDALATEPLWQRANRHGIFPQTCETHLWAGMKDVHDEIR